MRAKHCLRSEGPGAANLRAAVRTPSDIELSLRSAMTRRNTRITRGALLIRALGLDVRRDVRRQRGQIAKLRALGMSTRDAEYSLDVFLTTLKIFEDHARVAAASGRER